MAELDTKVVTNVVELGGRKIRPYGTSNIHGAEIIERRIRETIVVAGVANDAHVERCVVSKHHSPC